MYKPEQLEKAYKALQEVSNEISIATFTAEELITIDKTLEILKSKVK